MVHDFIVSSCSRAIEGVACPPQEENRMEAQTNLLELKNIERSPVCRETPSYVNKSDEQTHWNEGNNDNVSFVYAEPNPCRISRPIRGLHTWYAINSEFVLVNCEPGVIYLIHALRAYQSLCRKRLLMYEEALPHRPLLVPLTLCIQKNN
jgi:hypothetical protein